MDKHQLHLASRENVSHQWISSQSLSLLGSSVKEGLHNLHQAHDQSVTRIAMLLWSIWKSRNAMIFDNEAPKPMGSLIRAKRTWAEWQLRMSVLNPHSTPPSHSSHNSEATRLIGWRSPPGGYLKLNFDGTHSSSGAAAGFVLRDWRGRLIQAGTRFLEDAPILVAEATAMRDGIKAALATGSRKLLVEGDNKIVIQAIKGQIHTPWQIQTLIQDIRNMIPPYVDCLFQHIYREGNLAADWMAKFGCLVRSVSILYFSFSFHRDFLSILMSDNLGSTLERRVA
uniref:RNase H type-1 domain-containing protein n=1 Tax=Opuntia streptacantha TaxID=393608 RepID=A0A7C9DFJ2_OPUST